MKRLSALVLLAALAVWQAPSQAQARVYNQAELDALLAPVALYPDPVLSHILVAATYPDDLRDAAAWSRANPHLTGEDAVRAVEPMPWHPSVKALVAFPDLLTRMDESPQWTADLGTAFLEQEPYVMDTVQGLRRRAQAAGSLQSNDQYSVQQQGQNIAVYPAQPQMVYVPYYDPYAVYGPWWWYSYRPVYWRPWFAPPAVFVSTRFFVTSVDWRHRHVRRPVTVVRPVQVRRPVHAHPRQFQSAAPVTIHNHAHPVRPIVDSVRIQAQHGAQGDSSQVRREFRRERRVAAPPPVTFHNQPQPAAQAPRPQIRRDHWVENRAVQPGTIQSRAPAVGAIVQPVPQLRRAYSAPGEQRREQRQEGSRPQQRRG
jgi:uncharacterized protein DUF3300